MIKITRFLYINVLVVPLILIAFLTKSQMTFFISYGVVLIHELFHLFSALLLNVKVLSMIVMPFGMTVRLDSSFARSCSKETVIALAGPVSNIFMLVIGFTLRDFFNHNINYYLFMIINCAVLLLNLVPVPPLDGGRIVKALFVSRLGIMPAAKIMKRISYFFIGIISMLGIFLFVFFKGNPSLIMIAAFLVYSLTDEKKNSDILIMRKMIYEKEKLKNNSLIPCKLICISENTPAKFVLKKLNFDTFYIVSVIDENMEIIKTITESDFLRAVTKKGYGICAKDVI